MDYYVYAHKKETNNEIFYIGKGRGSRLRTENNRNRHWHNTASKHGYFAELIEENISEAEAFELETFLIEEIGRKDMRTGPLVNMTNGGEGVSGLVHSESAKQKMSESHKGVPLSETHKSNMLAAVRVANLSPPVREKKSANAKKMWANPEHRAKHSEGLKAALARPQTHKRFSETTASEWKDPEIRAKRIKGLKEAAKKKMRAVVCIDTGESFENATAAAASVGRTRAAIQSAIARNGKCAGSTWRYNNG